MLHNVKVKIDHDLNPEFYKPTVELGFRMVSFKIKFFLCSVSPFKGSFFQKVMANFSNLSNCYSCEPKIVPALLIPVNDNNKMQAIL